MKIHLSLLLLSVVLVERIQAQSIAIPVNNTDEQDTDPQWGVTFNGTNIDFLNNNNTNDDLGYSGDDDDATGGYGYEGLPESAGREDCGNATDIASVPFTDSNSTSGRLGQGGFADARTCTFVGRFTVGAWYVVRGDGSCFNASTAGSMFDTTLSVYTGLDGCTDLQCLDSNDDRQVNSTGYGYGGYNGDEGEGPGGYNGPYGGYNGSYGGYGGTLGAHYVSKGISLCWVESGGTHVHPFGSRASLVFLCVLLLYRRWQRRWWLRRIQRRRCL
jgi:hypothetical protein